MTKREELLRESLYDIMLHMDYFLDMYGIDVVESLGFPNQMKVLEECGIDTNQLRKLKELIEENE